MTKFTGKSRGIKNVNITVNKGDIFGFLGPNGAGKSTTIRTILDFIRPTGGSASVFGLDCQKDSVAIKERIGYIPGDFGLYGNMTGWKFLRISAAYAADTMRVSAKKYAHTFDISLDRKMKEYSRGMRQKVAIIQAFMNNPEVVIMDEPTNGLDPLVQQVFMDVLQEQARSGTTIFMSSHVLSDVEKVCNRVAIIKEGSIVAEEQVEALRQKSGKVINVKFVEPVDASIFKIEGITRRGQAYGIL